MREFSDKNFRENHNTNFMFNNSPENPFFYEIMWNNTV